jgi:pyruvate dehydrogenase E2 component (dihydrolipoamide acetyltransferase)
MYGIDSFTAVINPPGSAIMALGSAVRKPVVNDSDEIEIRSVMKATLSCDHRVVDGAVGAAFMKEFKKLIEEPLRVLI